MDKETEVCYLCPTKRHIIVDKIFEINSNHVSLEIEHSLA